MLRVGLEREREARDDGAHAPIAPSLSERDHLGGQRLMAIHEALFDDHAAPPRQRRQCDRRHADRARAAFRTARACRRRSRPASTARARCWAGECRRRRSTDRRAAPGNPATARGMSCSRACSVARAPASRLATARSSPRRDARKAGIRRRLMRAVPRIPQRTHQPFGLQLRQHAAVEFLGLAARDRERLPTRPAQVLGEQQDLVRVSRIVRHLPADRFVDRMRLAADHDVALQIGVGQWRQRIEEALPAVLPLGQQLRARLTGDPRTPDRASDPASRRRWSGNRPSAIACCRPCAASTPPRCWPPDRS